MAIDPYCRITTPDRLQREESEDDVAHAFRRGILRHVAPGIITGPAAPRWWDEAIVEGWRPTCLSAAEMHGLWIPPRVGTKLHAYRVRTSRGQAPKGIVPHRWHSAWPESPPAASVALLLEHAAHCLDLETCLVLAESALNRQLIGLPDWQRGLEHVPTRRLPALRRARTTSQSGSETRVGYMLDRRRIPFEPQAFIPGVGRVDALVKDIWVIECDSQAHHGAERDHRIDRGRDLSLQARGYISTRLSFPQIWDTWEETMRILLGTWESVRRRKRRPRAA